ncbi:MAG: hypothetical protein ACYC4L_12635 [Chloroflexota bacterium]
MPRHRANGDGSIYQRADERWCVELEIGRYPSGRPLRWRKSSMDRSVVASALAQAVADHGRGRLAASDQVTMESYLG